MTDAWHITELLAQGSAWKYPWTPTWTDSLWLPASIGIVCIAIVAICYLVELRGVSLSRRAMFTMLRSAAILLIGWMLLGWSWTPYAEEPADLVILVDSSRSMSTEDVEPQPRGQEKKSVSRLESVKSMLGESGRVGLLTELAEEYRPRIAHFDEQTAWLSIDAVKQRQELQSLTARGASTRLGDAIHDALRLQRGRPAAAIVVISDGVRTDGMTLDSAVTEAKAASVPLYVIGIGEYRPTRDVRIANLFCPPTAFLGDVINIEADVETEGFAERTLRVQLKGPKENEPLFVESVTLRAGKATSHVRIPIRPTELGEWKFSFEVERPEGDLNPENNLVRGVVRVQEETVRVLLVDRRPRYDIRYLIDLLSRARKRGAKTEPAFEVKTFLQEGDPGLSKQDSVALDVFPSRDELARYDVLVLGDIDPQLLGAATQRDLIEVVTRAGAGLVILPSASEGLGRWEHQPLEFFLPARAGEMTFVPEMEVSRSGVLSAVGKQTPFCLLGDKVNQTDASWKTLPPLVGLLTTARLRPDVRVLVEASDLRVENGRPSPMVTTHYVGSAMVLCHWTDEWWRWGAPSTRGHYDQYWMQAIRALCNQKTTFGDEQFEIRTDEARYEEGQSVKLSLQFRDERRAPTEAQGVVISVRGDGASREIVLTREEDRRDLFRGSVANLPPGNYLAIVVRPAIGDGVEKECTFEVIARASESARLKPDFDALRKLASQSGGKFYTVATAKRLAAELPRGTAVRTTPLAPRSAWNLPVWAALLVATLSLEWFLRRAGGLL